MDETFQERVQRIREERASHCVKLSKITDSSYRLILPENTIKIEVTRPQKKIPPVPLDVPGVYPVKVGQSVIAHLSFPDGKPTRATITAYPDHFSYSPETIDYDPGKDAYPGPGILMSDRLQALLPNINQQTQGDFILWIEQARTKTGQKTQLRLYLMGFSEAAWEDLAGPLYTRYPEAEIHLETILKRESLVICLLASIEDFDPNFFNTLRREKKIAWWEYPTGTPTTRWLDPFYSRGYVWPDE